jgi:hypothetical protein
MMTGVLEISRLWESAPDLAEELAERAEREGFNLRQIRQLVAKAFAPADVHEKSNERRADTPPITEETRVAGIREKSNEQRVDTLFVTNGTDSVPSPAKQVTDLGAQIEVEAGRILAQLQIWQRQASDSSVQEVIGRSCERILGEIQQIINLIETS